MKGRARARASGSEPGGGDRLASEPAGAGVLVIDKPAGITSHDVVARVRRALRDTAPEGTRRPKVGHTGTLDPAATGVLVLCLGRATRLVPYLQAGRKTYDARVQLGVTTTTLDAEGAVVGVRDASGIDEQSVCDVLKSFVGPIEQVPPMVSAVKVGGERLYEKARRGEEVARSARRVSIHDLVLEDFRPGERAEIAFLVTCSAGTYVRVLAADIGEQLGVGAHLRSLRRLASGNARIEAAVTLGVAEQAIRSGRLADILVEPAEAMASYPSVVLDPDRARDLGFGRSLPPTGHEGPVAALDQRGRLRGVLADRDGRARPLVVLATDGGS